MTDKWVTCPWGRYKTVWESEIKKIKILEVFFGQRLSLQYHEHRTERWTLIQGDALANIGGMNIAFGVGDSINIGKGAIHRLSNKGSFPVVVIEIQEGICEEKDIVRLEDDYKRI